MSYIGYVHVCNTFLVSNNKKISKVKETQDKKLRNLLLKNMGKILKHAKILIKLYLIFQVITMDPGS